MNLIIYFCFSSMHIITQFFSVLVHCCKEIQLRFAPFTFRLSDICKSNVRRVFFFEYTCSSLTAFIEKSEYSTAVKCLHRQPYSLVQRCIMMFPWLAIRLQLYTTQVSCATSYQETAHTTRSDKSRLMVKY